MIHKSYGRDSGGCGSSLLIAGQKSITTTAAVVPGTENYQSYC